MKMNKEVIKYGGRGHGKSAMGAQLMLSYCVKVVAPNPLMLYKSQYEDLEALGLDMTGCEVIGRVPDT